MTTETATAVDIRSDTSQRIGIAGCDVFYIGYGRAVPPAPVPPNKQSGYGFNYGNDYGN